MRLYMITSSLTSDLRWAMLGLEECYIVNTLNDMVFYLYFNATNNPTTDEIRHCVEDTFHYLTIDDVIIDDFISKYTNEDILAMVGIDDEPDTYTEIQFLVIQWLINIFTQLLIEFISCYGELFICNNELSIKKIYTIDVDRYAIGI